MKIPSSLCLLVLALSLPLASSAQEVEQPDEPVVTSDYQPSPTEPQVVITSGEDATFYEYRVNGELKEIKVVPNRGPAYYLVPAEGGGWIQEEKSQILIPSWIIFSW